MFEAQKEGKIYHRVKHPMNEYLYPNLLELVILELQLLWVS